MPQHQRGDYRPFKLLFWIFLVVLSGCDQSGLTKTIKTLDALILRDGLTRSCLRAGDGNHCLSRVDSVFLDFEALALVDISYQTEVNKTFDSLDYCLAYEVRRKDDKNVTIFYLHVGSEKYRKKYEAYEQFTDGRKKILLVDSRWSVSENVVLA